MKVSYYPGCALHGTAIEYDESTKAVSRMLGVELCELPDWNCCGASSAHATDSSLALNLAARNLAIASAQGRDTVVPCAACYSRLKAAAHERHQEAGNGNHQPAPNILSLLEFLSGYELNSKMTALRQKSLAGLKLVCYYGCLLVRPPKVTGAKNCENPEQMDRLLKIMGAEVLPWSYKTDCCGGSLVLTRPDIVRHLVQRLLERAIEAGAEAIVVACPLCQSNLDSRQEEISREAGKIYAVPVLYITELAGLALGHSEAPKWFKRHLVNPKKLLATKGLW